MVQQSSSSSRNSKSDTNPAPSSKKQAGWGAVQSCGWFMFGALVMTGFQQFQARKATTDTPKRGAVDTPLAPPPASGIVASPAAHIRGATAATVIRRLDKITQNLEGAPASKPAEVATPTMPAVVPEATPEPRSEVSKPQRVLTDFGSSSSPALLVTQPVSKLRTFAQQAELWKSADITVDLDVEVSELLVELQGSIRAAIGFLKEKKRDEAQVVTPIQSLASKYSLVVRAIREKLEQADEKVLPAEERVTHLFDLPANRLKKDSSLYLDSPKVAKYGNPEVLLRRILKEATGRELGADITLTGDPSISEPFAVDTANRKVSVFVNGSLGRYELMLGNLAAGTGAMIKQILEQGDAGAEKKSVGKQLTARQHAAGYALQSVVLGHLIANYPEFSFDPQLGLLTDWSFREGSGDEVFDSGRKMYNAVVTALGSPHEAFNYLITDKSLTKEMESAMNSAPTIAPRRIDVVHEKLSKALGEISEIFVLEGERCLEEKRYKDAVAYYSKAIEIKPEEASYLTSRGDAYTALNEGEKAKADFEKAGQLAAAKKNQK